MRPEDLEDGASYSFDKFMDAILLSEQHARVPEDAVDAETPQQRRHRRERSRVNKGTRFVRVQ